MDVAHRIQQTGGSLTGAERRVAEALLARPQLVGFGTVADLAAEAGAGAATVIRLATKLGFSGFTELQASVQRDLAQQLRPAAERIREETGDHPLQRHREAELGNVAATLDAVDPAACQTVVKMLSDRDREVKVVAGDAAAGVALQFATDMNALRSDVRLVDGNEVAVRRQLALADHDAVVVAIDLRRYDRWVLDAVEDVRRRGLTIIAVADSVLSPIAAASAHTFVLSAAAVSPFDSHVGTLALLNLLVTGVADVVRDSASDRLDRVEAAWSESGALTEG